MTDRELLELAAKALGIKGAEWQDWPGYEVRTGLTCGLWSEETGHWNPLEDDGAALRLAVALRMNIIIYAAGAEADVDASPETCKVGGDPYRATRRAIVLAAAEVGRAMQ